MRVCCYYESDTSYPSNLSNRWRSLARSPTDMSRSVGISSNRTQRRTDAGGGGGGGGGGGNRVSLPRAPQPYEPKVEA